MGACGRLLAAVKKMVQGRWKGQERSRAGRFVLAWVHSAVAPAEHRCLAVHCTFLDKAKGPPRWREVGMETTTFKYLNTTTCCKCAVVAGFTQIISFVPIAAQGHDIGLIFQEKRLKHWCKSKITESAIVRKVTLGFGTQIQLSFHFTKAVSHYPATNTEAHFLHGKPPRKD